MTYSLIVQRRAIVNAQIAFAWYETIRQGLGFELLEEIENLLREN